MSRGISLKFNYVSLVYDDEQNSEVISDCQRKLTHSGALARNNIKNSWFSFFACCKNVCDLAAFLRVCFGDVFIVFEV